jgi:DNA-binding NtrC family response regulator
MLAIPPNLEDRTQTILIVDDDKMILDLLSEAFTKMHDLKVFKAENGLDGLDLFEKEHIDIILTDIWMPGIDGIELSKRIRNMSPDTKIAVMTGGDADVAKELLNDGTVNFLFRKPFAIGAICKSLMAEAQTA